MDQNHLYWHFSETIWASRLASLVFCPRAGLVCLCVYVWQGWGWCREWGSKGENMYEVLDLGRGCCCRGVPTFSIAPSSLHNQACHQKLRRALDKMISKTRVEEGGFPGSYEVNSREDKNLEAEAESQVKRENRVLERRACLVVAGRKKVSELSTLHFRLFSKVATLEEWFRKTLPMST